MKAFLFLALVGLMTMLSTPAIAASKLWVGAPTLTVLKFRVDLSKSDVAAGVANGSVAAHNLGNLPTGFVILGVYASAVSATITGGGSIVVGEDGGGDADGYCLDLDAIATATMVKCAGALIHTSPATANEIGNEKPYKVASATDGFTYTIASTAYTAGIIEFSVVGYQGE